ncbi:stage 0 sporulation family protein [bacterium]
MPIVVGLIIRKPREFVYGDPHSLDIKVDDRVIIKTDNGLEFAEVVNKEKTIETTKIPIYKIVRKLSTIDEERMQRLREKQIKALRTCQRKIDELKLKMNLTCVEYIFDRSKLFVYYTADSRVDFRQLIKDLGQTLKTKIQMVQIGVRDEARMMGGFGHCGRKLCCASFLHDFKPVVIDMAKDQKLALNPSKISGCCGRLMCCLSYENAFYKEMAKKMPKVGSKISTKDGIGLVKSTNMFKEDIEVIFDDGSVTIFKLSELPKRKEHNKKKNEK